MAKNIIADVLIIAAIVVSFVGAYYFIKRNKL